MKKCVTRLFALILSVQLLVSALPMTAAAAETGGVKLSRNDSPGARPFQATDMFPGDTVTKIYTVTTVHDNPTILYFQADVTSGSQALAEALNIRVTADGKKLYEGSLTGCIAQAYPLGAEKKTAQYRVDVSLPTSAGNECMNKKLLADFRWWYLDGESDGAVTIQPVAEVLVDTSYPTGSDFTFRLTDHLGNTWDVKNQDGYVYFPSLSFDKPGVYTYTITQIPGSNPDLTYDTAVYVATVTVTGAPGSWKVTISYTRNGQSWKGTPRFVNVTKGQSVPSDPSEITPDNPKMGDSFPLKLYSAVAVASLGALICLVLLWQERRKEAGRE